MYKEACYESIRVYYESWVLDDAISRCCTYFPAKYYSVSQAQTERDRNWSMSQSEYASSFSYALFLV